MTKLVDPSWNRLAYQRNPLRLPVTIAPWAATAYLLSYVPVGAGMFAVGLVALLVAGVLNITWLGLPLLVGAAAVLRGCATVERRRAGLVAHPVVANYQPVTGTGVFAHLRTRWHDRATFRDIAYLIFLFPPLVVLAGGTLIVWGSVLGGITLPVWYWAVPPEWRRYPDAGNGVVLGHLSSPTGPGFGVWIHTLPGALLAAVVFAVLAVPASHLVVAVARLQLWLARGLLGPYVDPLAEAKRILAEPGPLGRIDPRPLSSGDN